ncbi:NADH-cytochrome b5 reductase-like [Coemansia sp. BCRC 34301]|nr:NADH-cytochrome b5 reductase-like [Coemansia sp. BCRC 34301]
MLSRLLVTLKPFALAIAASQYQRPLRPFLSPVRLFATQSLAKPSADIQKAIAEEARLLQQTDESIPWYRLAAKYHLPIDEVQSVYEQAEDEAQQRQQQSVRVTMAAERHFDSVLGRCNWNAVSIEVGLPLIECVDLFDASVSTIKPQSLIDTTGGWPKADVDELKYFVAAYFADSSAVDWKLAGAFMNVDSLECRRIGQGTYNGPINAVAYKRICEYREFGRCWKDIHQHFWQYPTSTVLRIRFYALRTKLEARLVTKYATKWTDDERERAKEIVRRHQASMATPELVDAVQRELPHKPANDISLIARRLRRELKFGQMTSTLMTRLRELVVECGEDWDRIGQELDVLPSRVLRNWKRYCESGGNRADWSFDDTLQLQHLTVAGIKPKEAAKLLGAKKQDMDDGEHPATSEARKQLESGSIAVDWLQVSQATGLGFRECLEQSQYDVDKTPWHYDPNSFSQSTVDRMTSFIEEHYPAPTPVNYRTVSNYLWIDMDDCICIHSMLQGKFKWTKVAIKRAADLRAQRLAFKDIARRLSPTLSSGSVRSALRRQSGEKPAAIPISDDEKEEIRRLVDDYARKYPVSEVTAKIRTQLSLPKRSEYHVALAWLIAAHPYYQAKLHSIDFNDLANRIGSGQTTMGGATNPAVAALLEEIARAKLRAEERRRASAEAKSVQYGVVRDGDSVILRLPPAPQKPGDSDCCKSGCTPCILDSYQDRLHAYNEDVRALQAQYERVLGGAPIDASEHHIRHALPGGLLEPLQFIGIAVMHTHILGNGLARLVVLEASASNFVLALGEHVQIRATFSDGLRVTRPYTPVMIEAPDGVVRPHLFVTLYSADHRMSGFWREVEAGQRLAVRGPVTTQENMTQAFAGDVCVLAAAGSGIAPIFQVLQFAHVNSAYRNKRIVVVHCARDRTGLWLLRELLVFAKEMSGLEYRAFLSNESAPAIAGDPQVTPERLSEALLIRAVGPLSGVHCAAMVCGPDTFNRDVSAWLRAAGACGIQVLDA